jgi:NADH dehydrogenase, FAD-containing subunit
LLGEKNTSGHLSEKVAAYEAAFDAYVMQDFAQAIAILEQNNGDPPSAFCSTAVWNFKRPRPPRIGAESMFQCQSKTPPEFLMTDTKKRVLILGGGFGGVYVAVHLGKLLSKKEHEEIEIVLVNRENYIVFQPLLPEVVSGSVALIM